MITQKELEMYHTQKKNIRVKCRDGKTIEGFCDFFTQALDNEPEEASITLNSPRDVKANMVLSPYTEIMEHEIEKIEYLD